MNFISTLRLSKNKITRGRGHLGSFGRFVGEKKEKFTSHAAVGKIKRGGNLKQKTSHQNYK
jgi:hypothetical protein